MTEYSYSARHRPPAPVIPVLVGVPGSQACIALEARIDTGSDYTTIPYGLAEDIGLPLVRFARIHGVDAIIRRTPVWAAVIDVEGHARIYETLALGTEMLLGRNVLESLELRLDGRKRVLDVRIT